MQARADLDAILDMEPNTRSNANCNAALAALTSLGLGHVFSEIEDPDVTRELLRQMTVQQIEPYKPLIQQGELSSCVYLVLDGVVDVWHMKALENKSAADKAIIAELGREYIALSLAHQAH